MLWHRKDHVLDNTALLMVSWPVQSQSEWYLFPMFYGDQLFVVTICWITPTRAARQVTGCMESVHYQVPSPWTRYYLLALLDKSLYVCHQMLFWSVTWNVFQVLVVCVGCNEILCLWFCIGSKFSCLEFKELLLLL